MRVRLLVDDMDARAKNAGFAALAAHPHIEVRLFNPFATRSGGMRLAGEGMRDFGRINRRMHNKSWIADNRIALVGGRNLGDEYFAASDEVNFVDLDFAMVGPVVRDVSASFDRFWNSAQRLADASCSTPNRSTQRRSRSCARGWRKTPLRPRPPNTPRHCARTTACSGCCPATGRCTGRPTTSSCPTIPPR